MNAQNPGQRKSALSKPAAATSRRTFLRGAAATAVFAGGVFDIVPSHVLGQAVGKVAPSSKLNIAGIGVGGMGHHNLDMMSGENIVALCDVDPNYAAKSIKKYPSAKVYSDFREMLDKQKDIDACLVATPDHTHAVIGMACIKAGKHVYIQKPLAHSVSEARALTLAAREHKVMTQMGNQGHSGEGARLISEWLAADAIGAVREVHAWTNRPVWPQGIEVGRPTDTPAPPEGMDWDKWIGPAQMRPYNPAYHPQKWRAWWDFGTGSLGDMGCHILDPVFWALKCKYPESVEGCISTYWEGMWKETKPKNETYPRSSIARFHFPEREGLPPVDLTWWDGGLMPPRPPELEEGRRMGDSDGGVLFIGDKGKLMCGCYGKSPTLVPDTAMKAFKRPPKTLARIPKGEDGHELDWIRSCKDLKPASSNFDYSGPLSEMVLMGNLAVRYPQRRLLWDGEKMTVTNDKEANSYLTPQYREGWTL